MNKFIVLDINHGGDYLAAILKSRGYEVIIYDIYQTNGEKRQELNKKNIGIIESVDTEYKEYTVVHPAHCPDHFLSSFSKNKKLTHHELVKFLFNGKNNVIEITGSKGKTTTAHVLAHLLSFGDNVILNSSTGLETILNGIYKLIDENNSISPGYTAKILFQQNNNFYVLEESLGVCGIGNISILTSMDPVYTIKGGKGNSLEAKKNLFELSERNIIIDGKDKIATNLVEKYQKEVFRIWEDVRIEIPDYLEIGKDIYSNIYFKDLELQTKFSGKYLLAGYANSILFGSMALKILNRDLRKIPENLSTFNGVENRMSVVNETSYTRIIDKSGGFSEDSLRYLLSLLKRNYDMFYKKINLLIDLDNVSHCQKIDIYALDKVIGEFGNLVDNAFLTGNHDFERFKYLKNSAELNIEKGDLLIECGK